MANSSNDSADITPDSPRDSGLEKSFVGKVVSGLFNSTPLSKWFSKEPKSSVRKRDEEDEEEFDATYTFQPPTKRAKLPSESQRNNHSAHVFESPVTVHNASNNVNKVASKVYGKFPEPVPSTSGINSRKLFQKHNTASANTLSSNSFESRDVINGDNSDSEESTSGYSSAPRLVPKSGNDEVLKSKETYDKVTPKTRSLFTSSNDSSFGRSLFADRSPHMNTSLSSRRPTFNASTFGSPNFVDRTLSTERILSSPFYSGNTIYGGASAYGRKFGRNADESRATVHIKPVNEKPANETATLSKTARRILNTLEQYSTPIRDAKKIPVTPRREGLLSQYVGATPYLVRDKRKAAYKELQVPSVPELLQMKQKERLQNSTETVRQIATKSKSTLNTNEEYTLPTVQADKPKHSNKMKNNISSVRPKVQSDEPVSAVKLPTVSLPITTLPKFDLIMMPPVTSGETKLSSPSTSRITNVTKSPLTAVSSKPAPVIEKKETEKRIVENGKTHYTFAKPLVILETVKPLPAINCFNFSEPLCKKQDSEKDLNFKMGDKTPNAVKLKNNGDTITPKVATPVAGISNVFNNLKRKETTATKDTWECETCLHENNADKESCVACNEPKTELSAKKKMLGFGEKFKMTSDKWECGSCLVRNNNSDNTCVACASAKPGAGKTTATTVQSGFGDKFKPPASTWECTSCLIRNKDDLLKCQACGADKTPPKTPATGFGSQFKAASDTWECGTCMIRNKNSVDKCVACETPNSEAKSTPKTMNLPKAPIQKFDFGFKTEWQCRTCSTKNKNELTKCASCQKPKDSFGGSFSMKQGEWECASCLVRNKPASTVCVCCGAAKPGSTQPIVLDNTPEDKPIISFNFGIDKSTVYKFGIPATSSEANTTPVSTQASFVFGGAKPAPEATPNSFNFGINSTQEKATPSQPVVSSTSGSAAINPLLKPNEKLPEEAAPAAAGFKFGIDSKVKNPPPNETVVSSSSSSSKTDAIATPVSTFGAGTSAAMFQFKPATSTTGFSFGNGAATNAKTTVGGFSFSSPNTGINFGSKAENQTFASNTQEKATPSQVATGNGAANPLLKPNEKLPAETAPATSEFQFGVGSGGVKNPAGNEAVVSNKTEATAATSGSAFPSMPMFQFKAPTVNGSGTEFPAFGASQTFGQATEPTQSQPFAFTSSEPQKNSGFSFSAADKPPNPAANAPVFNFGGGAAANAKSSGGFNFAAPSTGFNFGSAAKVENQTFAPNPTPSVLAAKNGSFNFGTNANNNNQKAVFSFGASQPSQASFPSQSQPAFNFGASTPLSTPQPGGLTFTGPPAGPPTFNFDASSTTGQQRRFKKAVRRTNTHR